MPARLASAARRTNILAAARIVVGKRWGRMLSMRDLLRVELSEQGDELKLLHEYLSQ
jgi:hypothetical protein